MKKVCPILRVTVHPLVRQRRAMHAILGPEKSSIKETTDLPHKKEDKKTPKVRLKGRKYQTMG